MHGELVPIIIVPALFFMIAYIFATISNNRLRRLLITNQVSSDVVDKLILGKPEPDLESALKYGLVGVFIGISFIIIEMLRLDGGDAMTYGILFLFTGGGLLSYYALARLINK